MLSKKWKKGEKAQTPVVNPTPEFYGPKIGVPSVQINSKSFTFEPRSETLVDDHLIWALERFHGEKGLYVKYDDLNEEEIKELEAKALQTYISNTGILGKRINNYTRDRDESVKRGETYIESLEFKQAKQWKEEIQQYLKIRNKEINTKSFFELAGIENKDDAKPKKTKKIKEEIPLEEGA